MELTPFGCAAGVTGGFAGGERGVQQYVEEGDLKLAPPGRGKHLNVQISRMSQLALPAEALCTQSPICSSIILLLMQNMPQHIYCIHEHCRFAVCGGLQGGNSAR